MQQVAKKPEKDDDIYNIEKLRCRKPLEIEQGQNFK